MNDFLLGNKTLVNIKQTKKIQTPRRCTESTQNMLSRSTKQNKKYKQKTSKLELG